MISEIFTRWYRAPEVMLNAKVSHGHLEPVLRFSRAEILKCQSKATAPNEMQTNRTKNGRLHCATKPPIRTETERCHFVCLTSQSAQRTDIGAPRVKIFILLNRVATSDFSDLRGLCTSAVDYNALRG